MVGKAMMSIRFRVRDVLTQGTTIGLVGVLLVFNCANIMACQACVVIVTHDAVISSSAIDTVVLVI